MKKLTGSAAIEYAEAHSLTLNKYADPVEDAREGLSPVEARAVAREDPALIYIETESLGEVINRLGGASELHSTVALAPECLNESATLLATRGGYEIYQLECGDWFLSHNNGSTWLVTRDDVADLTTEQACVVAATKYAGKDLDVICDNGGGITIQARGFVHTYSDPQQAARDCKAILSADYDPSDWDGDEPENYLAYDGQVERNGGYSWQDRQCVETIIAEGTLADCNGYAMRDFYRTLGVRITDDNYSG